MEDVQCALAGVYEGVQITEKTGELLCQPVCGVLTGKKELYKKSHLRIT